MVQQKPQILNQTNDTLQGRFASKDVWTVIISGMHCDIFQLQWRDVFYALLFASFCILFWVVARAKDSYEGTGRLRISGFVWDRVVWYNVFLEGVLWGDVLLKSDMCCFSGSCWKGMWFFLLEHLMGHVMFGNSISITQQTIDDPLVLVSFSDLHWTSLMLLFTCHAL